MDLVKQVMHASRQRFDLKHLARLGIVVLAPFGAGAPDEVARHGAQLHETLCAASPSDRGCGDDDRVIGTSSCKASEPQRVVDGLDARGIAVAVVVDGPVPVRDHVAKPQAGCRHTSAIRQGAAHGSQGSLKAVLPRRHLRFEPLSASMLLAQEIQQLAFAALEEPQVPDQLALLVAQPYAHRQRVHKQDVKRIVVPGLPSTRPCHGPQRCQGGAQGLHFWNAR
mmetsp:Transcript_14886/g.42719  ORF Transcript_14886/g.42719 Transcript_14886/m.42719 type:complete len:224 (-) Transcript_14886:466-1137(-)